MERSFVSTPAHRYHPSLLVLSSFYPAVQPLHGETYLQAKRREIKLVEFYGMLAYVKSCVDTGPPKTHVSVKVKLKKLMEEGLKLAELEFNNRLMLKRIINAMNAPATTDNHLNIQNRPFSLNFGARMMEADRINAENFRTLTRILQVKPCYDRIKQEQSYRHLTKDRKSSKDVIKLWKKLAHERKKEIMEGGPAASRYGHEDPDVLRARSARLHQNCFPEYFTYDSFYRPVPSFCRLDPDAKKIDHSRCLRDDREMFQPFPSIRRSPKQLTSPPQYEFASTRTTQLRAKEVKKRARQWKTFGLKPQKPKARSEEAEPVQNVAFNADSFKQKKDPSIKDNSSGKSKNRSASATGPYPPPAVTHTCDPLVIEHSNISSPKVPPGPGSPNVLDAKKTSPVLPSAARPRAQPDKSPQAVIGTVEVKGCVADRRSADKNSSFLARMCRDTSSSEGELDETIIASEDIPSRPASRECHSTSSEGTDSEERALPLPKAAEKGRKKVVVISDEDAFKASKPQGLSSSSAHYSTSWTTDEESAGPKTARKEKDGSKRSVKTTKRTTSGGRQKGKEVSIGTSSRAERSHADNTSDDGEDLPLSSWVSSPELSSSTSPVSGRMAPQHSDKEYVEDFTSSSQRSSQRSGMESEGEASSKHLSRQE